MMAALLALCLMAPAAMATEQEEGDHHGRNLLKNIPVAGTLSDGTAFQGILSIADLSYENGALLASGVLRGRIGNRNVRQVFETVPLGLSEPPAVPGAAAVRAPNEPGVCDILFLDLPPIFLDLLGLTVDLSAIQLDLDAVPGPGNLLGNLLCALLGLLDPGLGLGDLLNNIIQSILNAINQLL
jgi:hypothetical protein